uniref:Transcription termination factor 2 n=1 Tax=Esox lucius TaxID=8010 RepID=A0AAY5L7P3_ESOLU
MEIILCKIHGSTCMLKTGVKEGPNNGKSFYVCGDRQKATPCDFTQVANIPSSHCLNHEDSMVELQSLILSQQQQGYRLYYRCVSGKKAGQRWCGNIPWTAPHTEKRSPLSDRQLQLQSSCLPPERNPFKASGKKDQTSEWRRLQDGERRVVEGEGRKEKGAVEEEREKSSPSECWRDKPLPTGMKVKKRVSDEENEKSAESSPEEKVKTAKEMKDKTSSKEVHGQAERSRNSSPKDSEKHAGKKTIPGKTSSLSDVIGITSNDTQLPKSTKTTKTLIPQCDEPAMPVSTTSKHDKGTDKTSASSHPNQGESHRAKPSDDDDDDDDDVQFVSMLPGTKTTSPAMAPVQKTLTSFPGFQTASRVKSQQEDPRARHNQLTAQLRQKKATLSAVNVSALPDKGERLKSQVKELEDALESLCLTTSTEPVMEVQNRVTHALSGFSDLQNQAFYGGRMTENRLLAVKNATSEAINHLHSSLESCPDPDTEVLDPKGIKVPLLAHQRRGLAWLLWRETQNPCGGILADDMGLGKTLTMIALILAQKKKRKEEEEKEEERDPKLSVWLSKDDSSLVVSQGTLIICPASLVHHWKKEIERHVKSSRLTVYLYHGPNRQKSAKVLAEHDVVVTTYSLVSKEVPVQKEDAEIPSKDSEDPSGLHPLMRVEWARVVLDEAHNIKNPKVQTSMAVCKLRAKARWAVTGTPIQNNLLDMYSLLKFLRCAPFDEYKLWKSQVDNGSNRGGERLNILTRTLLLRRTKDQMDSTGKPLVNLPERTSEVHRLKLSVDEQSVYDVVFARSRSTLQNYLKRHEGDSGKKGDNSNPFDKVAREFGVSQPDPGFSSQQSQGPTSAVHILSLLLRLRQCCCHLSLLKKTLDSSELQGDGITLSLEEQLNALCLSADTSGPDPKATVSLNGSRFASDLFEDTHESTKVTSTAACRLECIRQNSEAQKSVIVSQWTSMLHVVAVHLRRMGLSFAVIDGTVNPKRRMDLVEEFNTNPKGPQVMLVSLCAGGVGINLIGGNHLFLMDMHWNPALEDQACDRIYRVGQLRDVTIHRFVCEGTVEDKISTLQERKKELAQKVLSGTGASFTKLSLADLRVIFGV